MKNGKEGELASALRAGRPALPSQAHGRVDKAGLLAGRTPPARPKSTPRMENLEGDAGWGNDNRSTTEALSGARKRGPHSTGVQTSPTRWVTPLRAAASLRRILAGPRGTGRSLGAESRAGPRERRGSAYGRGGTRGRPELVSSERGFPEGAWIPRWKAGRLGSRLSESRLVARLSGVGRRERWGRSTTLRLRRGNYTIAARARLAISCKRGAEGRRAAAAAGSPLVPHVSSSPFQLGLQFVTR